MEFLRLFLSRHYLYISSYLFIYLFIHLFICNLLLTAVPNISARLD